MGRRLGCTLIALLTLTATPAFAAYPGENGRLALTRDGRLFTVEADGSGEQALTGAGDPKWVAEPDWSPDGRRIAYGSLDDAQPGIFLVNADGTCRGRLDPTATWASWDPDGRRLAISRQDLATHSASLYVVNADGTDKRYLPAFRNWQGPPAWSPDGGRIAFSAAPGSGQLRRGASIYVIGPDGAGQAQLPRTDEYGNQDGPDWSPDGRKITYTFTGDGGSRIDVADADGGQRAVINDGGAGPVWSPDGRKIAFTGSDGDHEIFVMNADGSGVTQVTHNTAEDFVSSWQPRPSLPAPSCPPPPGTGPGPGHGPGPGAAPPRDTVGPAMAISRRTVRAARRGVVAVRLRCPAAEPAGCRGRLSLRGGARRLGSAAFRLPAGRTAAVRVRLSRANRRLLARLRRMRVTATVRAVDQAGNARTTTASFVLRAPK